MDARWIALYHTLPPAARSVVATLRGAYLHYWRHGPGREELMRAALEHECWSADRWQIWRDERLAALLRRAATRVPWYRNQWADRRRRGDRSSFEQLENWPVLTKDDLRRNARAFVADDCNVRRMFHDQTSGTTGTPLDIWRSRPTVTALYAIDDLRTWIREGLPAGARWARIGGQLVVPGRQHRPPFWVWNAAMRQLYMSCYHLSPDFIPAYLDALRRYRIAFLTGYTSSLVALAHGALRHGVRDLRMLAAFTNAEPVTDSDREVVKEAFHCPLRETYGMAEAVAAASECPAGRLHQWPEVGHIEVFHGDAPAAPGETGDFICTGLLNADMPLIRYRVGDHGRLAAEDEVCDCGRLLPLIESIDGRTSDVLLTRDGRQVFWLNPVFYGLPIRESQIVQETLDRLRVRVAPASGFTERNARTIRDRLHERMGEIEICLEYVDVVPRTHAGKLRPVICNLESSERSAILRDTPARVS